jgi:hypothetical protein
VLRIKQLVFAEGLTLAGARRRLEEEDDRETAPRLRVEDVLGANVREKLRNVKSGLQSILEILARNGAGHQGELGLAAPPSRTPASKKKPVAKARSKK